MHGLVVTELLFLYRDKMEFLDLPLVMIENIFSYFSHDEIAKNRLVSFVNLIKIWLLYVKSLNKYDVIVVQ